MIFKWYIFELRHISKISFTPEKLVKTTFQKSTFFQTFKSDQTVPKWENQPGQPFNWKIQLSKIWSLRLLTFFCPAAIFWSSELVSVQIIIWTPKKFCEFISIKRFSFTINVRSFQVYLREKYFKKILKHTLHLFFIFLSIENFWLTYTLKSSYSSKFPI